MNGTLVDIPTLVSLYAITPQAAGLWLPFMEEAFKVAEIENRQRAACFLAQVGHESGQLRYVVELWGPTKQQLRYEPPSTLAKTLGNVLPGSGKRYMGRGLIQVTGEANYRLMTVEMRKILPGCPDFHAQPEQLAYKRYAALSAALFWKRKGLNSFCDRHDFAGLTKRINGGYNGLAHRQALYAKALGLLT